METSAKPKVRLKEISVRRVFDKKTIFLLVLAVILLLMFLISENVTIFDLIDLTLFQTNFLVLIVGTGFTFIAVLFDTAAWKMLLNISSIQPSWSSIYRIQLSSFAYGLLIPSAGAVEVIMRVILGKKEFTNENKDRLATSGEILSSVIVHKLCGLIAFIPISVFLAFAMFVYLSDMLANLPGGAPLPEGFGVTFVIFISLISILAVSFFVLIAKAPNIAKRIILTILGLFSRFPIIGVHIKEGMMSSEKIIDDFSIQFKYLGQNKFVSSLALILAFSSQIAHWISIYFILQSVQIPISIEQVAAVNFLSGTADLIPIGIPGMAGLKEITLKFFLQNGLGLNLDISWLGSILVQLVKVYFLVFVGILVYVAGKTRVTIEDLEETEI